MVSRCRSLLLVGLLLGSLVNAGAQNQTPINVYLLFGIPEAGKWEGSFASKFTELAEQSHLPILVFIEYLGYDESIPAADEAKIVAYLETKTRSFPASVVVSALPGAGHFLAKNGKALFGNVPKVYVIPKGADLEQISVQKESQVLRSASGDAIGLTLQAMQDLVPDLKKVVVIGGSSATDLNYPPIARGALESHFAQLDAEYWIGDTGAEVVSKAARLPRGVAILFTSMEMDREKHSYGSAEVLKSLTRAATVPVFSFYDTTLGSGIVGGNLTSSKSYSSQAFSMASQALGLQKNGPTGTASRFQFDARQLDRWGIDRSKLPDGSLVLFQEPDFWSQYQGLILTVLAILVLQLVWIVLLMRSNQRHKQTTAQLKESTGLLQSISDNFSAGMIYRVEIAPNGARHFTYLSDSVQRLYGVDRDAVLADASLIYSRIHPDEVDRIRATEDAALRSLSVFQVELRVRNPDETYRWSLLTSTPHPREDGSVVWDGIEFIITERKQAETEALRLQAQLLATQKLESIGSVAGGIAHDFNNLLAVILNHLELLELSSKGGQDHPRILKIQDAARRSAALTSRLLAFARLRSVSPETFSVNEKLTGMKDLLESLVGERHELVFDLTEGAWPVCMDPSHFDQVVSNLCVNARDAMTEKGTLTVGTKNVVKDGSYLVLSVRDTGCGMDESTMAHVFEPFFTTKPEGKGTGLGLATVFSVLQQNDGFVEIDSEVGKGSEFRVWIPAQSPNESQFSLT